MLIYGKNAIREAIISEKTFNKLLIDRNQKDKTSQEIIDLAKKNNVNNGQMTDYVPSDDDLAVGFAGLPEVDF